MESMKPKSFLYVYNVLDKGLPSSALGHGVLSLQKL